jgi:cytochrome c peroxidase
MTLVATGAPGVAPIASPTAEPVSPVRDSPPGDIAKVTLGEKLFHDRRLSHGDKIACATCHELEAGGDDQRRRPIGVAGRELDFNVPSIFNAGQNFRLNWRGNFRTFEELNEAVLLEPRLMGTNWEELLGKLSADDAYMQAFTSAYGAPPDRENVLDALAAFQASLTTPGARFDRYLEGDRTAITPEEERGYQLFKSYGCVACHQGENVGGNLFQKFGIFASPFAEEAEPARADLGRFTVTGDDADRHVFRVPSLRNVAVTAPYFHDGRAESLAQAVEVMAIYQLGRQLPREDIDSIVAFLKTLTGEYRGRPLAGVRGVSPS